MILKEAMHGDVGGLQLYFTPNKVLCIKCNILTHMKNWSLCNDRYLVSGCGKILKVAMSIPLCTVIVLTKLLS